MRAAPRSIPVSAHHYMEAGLPSGLAWQVCKRAFLPVMGDYH
jgi:hypothetical protein